MENIPVSVAIIAFDEAERLPACLSSLKGFKDIVVVVDSRSTDGTAKVAGDFGCRVYVEEWKGFGPQKQSAVDKCVNDHVLLLDADERLPHGSLQLIETALNNKADAYSLKRKNHIGRRWIKHAGWWPDRVIRLFDRNKCRVEGIVHEKVVVEGTVAHLDAAIEHYGVGGYSDIVQKMDRYTTLSAIELAAQKRDLSPFKPLTQSLWMFFMSYILRRGFMDGLDGLVISALNAGGAFFKYAKAIEMRKHIR